MIIGGIEGYLTGLVTINLKRPITGGKYGVIFEFRDQNGCFIKFIPQFVVIEYSSYLQFNVTGYESMYIRVTVSYHCRETLLPGQHIIPYGGELSHLHNECGPMNENWRVNR